MTLRSICASSGQAFKSSRPLLSMMLVFAAVAAPAVSRMHHAADALTQPRIDIRLAQSATNQSCHIQAHGSLEHGALTLRLAVQIADRCIEASSSYNAGKAC